MQRKLLKILKRLVSPEPHGMYHKGDLMERFVALRYSCQRSRSINQKSAIETIKLGIERYQVVKSKNETLLRQFAAFEAFANNKIAEHQNVEVLSEELDIYSIRSIIFEPCKRAYCLNAMIGINRADWLKTKGL